MLYTCQSFVFFTILIFQNTHFFVNLFDVSVNSVSIKYYHVIKLYLRGNETTCS